MKILMMGDIVGKSGRQVIEKHLPEIINVLGIDFVIANAENAAHGFGLTPKMFEHLRRTGVDVITMGNHTFDKKDIFPLMDSEPRIIRPMNYPEGTIGHGFGIFALPDGRFVGVAQVLGTLFMRPQGNPFDTLKAFLDKHPLGPQLQALIIDVHGEATSEKMGLGFMCDGKASLVAGTHTHVPTADAMILPHGTAYITDVGMCGDYHSIIGMKLSGALTNFLNNNKKERLEPAEEEGTLCGIFVQTDDTTGLAQQIRPIRLGAHLIRSL